MRGKLITEMARALCGAYRVDGKCPLCAGDCIDWQDNVDAIRAILPIAFEAAAKIAEPHLCGMFAAEMIRTEALKMEQGK